MKKIKKKSIDLEKEFIDGEVKYKKKSEKKPDLTEKINKFLEEPKSLESIKTILASLTFSSSQSEIDKMKIFVYSIPFRRECISYRFLIILDRGRYSDEFYLTSLSLCKLGLFSDREITTSNLKQTLQHEIYQWLRENMHFTKIVE